MRLITGDKLNASQRDSVLRRFVHRNTVEHKPSWRDNNPELYAPRETDTDWLATHAFYIREDGKLAYKPSHCEPSYFAGRDIGEGE